MNRITKKLILILLVAFNIFSQENILNSIISESKKINSEEHKNLARARSHENAGLLSEAQIIYKQLFSENPRNQQIFSAYKSFLKKQKKWILLIEISQIYSTTLDNDPYGKLALADSYLLAGEENSALSIFDNLFEEYSSDIKKLKRFTSKLLYFNKIEFALIKISKIRMKLDYPDFYSRELGTYYYSKMAYIESLDEYILYLNYSSDKLGTIREKLMTFPIDNQIMSNIRKTLKNYNSRLCNIILAEFEFKWENYDISYKLMIDNYIDELEVFDFANDMILVSQFYYAEKILNQLSLSNNAKIVELSIYQLANLLELKAQDDSVELPISDNIINNTFFELESFNKKNLNLESKTLRSAIIMYDSLITNHNSSAAKYKLVNLKYLINNDFNESITEFKKIEKASNDLNIRFNSAIKIIDLHIINGFIDSKLLSEVERYKQKYKLEDQQILLNLKTNQMLFYLNEFDALHENLKNILKSLPKKNLYYNDFIDALTILMLFDANPEKLNEFSISLYNIKKNNLDDALLLLLELSKSKEQIIANLSSYYLGYVYIRLNDYSSAKEILKSTSGHDIYSQICKLLYAEIEDYINTDINSAIDIYLDFLNIFESSIYYEDVRLRLGEIVS